MLEKD